MKQQDQEDAFAVAGPFAFALLLALGACWILTMVVA